MTNSNGNVIALHNTAERKATLIHQALDALKLASEIDESDSYVADWVSWYDATVADCTDIEKIAGAMRIELATRRGQLIIAEGEKRGGDQKSENQTVSVGQFDNATMLQRSKDRLIASEPEAVKTYVKQAPKPSIRGAVEAAKAARAQKHEESTDDDPPVVSSYQKPHGVTPRRSGKHAEFAAALEALADGQPHPIIRKGGHKAAGDLPTHLLSIDALAWLSPFYQVTIADNNITITPVKDLRAVFDEYRAGHNTPELNGAGALARHLWDGIKQREEEFSESKRSTNWSTYAQLSTAYGHWLDWIKKELARVLGE